MYSVTIQHPALAEDRTFTADSGGELRNIVWGVAKAQGKPITGDRDLEMIHEVGALRSHAEIEGEGTLTVGEITVRVERADESAYACDGHPDDDMVLLLHGSKFCDGSCKPRKPRTRFRSASLLDLVFALADAETDASGGCSACDTEAIEMCAGCGKCRCHQHDSCTRPTAAE
jgi:hypothetical protein